MEDKIYTGRQVDNLLHYIENSLMQEKSNLAFEKAILPTLNTVIGMRVGVGIGWANINEFKLQ